MLDDLQKRSDQISGRSKQYAGLLGAIVFADVIDHFEKERGESGRWKPWSKAYKASMAAKGRGGNKILQDTGRLKGGWLPTRYETSKAGIAWFNPVPYAGVHNDGSSRMPKRQFTWMSIKARRKMEVQTAKFLLKDT